jgi:hypothetical protein
MAIYLGSPTGPAFDKWHKLDEKARQEKEKTGVEAWKNWVVKTGKAVADVGSPLGKTKRVDAKGVSDAKNQLTAYTIVEAESHAEAAKLFLNHPHFMIFPGDCVEIMECLPLPKG